MSTTVFALVSASKAHPGQVDFDAYQQYVGPSALRQAKRDGLASLNGVVYRRNQHAHVQTLPLANGCRIIMLRPASPGGMSSVTSAAYLSQLRSRKQLFCWLLIGKGEVNAVVEQY